jgi:uncharacterized membrane protein
VALAPAAAVEAAPAQGGWPRVFGFVCGQSPTHTWAPGGRRPPCCQRCTGLYVGIALGCLLQLILQPRLSSRFLQVHGAFLLAMVPFGFHWVAHGEFLRTLTGAVYGFGVAGFLWLLPAQRRTVPPEAQRGRAWAYGLIVAASVVAVPWLAGHGGATAATALTWLAGSGLVALGVLVLANVAVGVMGRGSRIAESGRQA